MAFQKRNLRDFRRDRYFERVSYAYRAGVFAIDDDGDGIVSVPLESGGVQVRATACVWSSGADGKFNKSRSKGDDVFSWRLEQEVR